jgi:hypothetical protein
MPDPIPREDAAIADVRQRLEAIAEISRCLDDEIGRRDYNAARVSADHLYGKLDELDALAASVSDEDGRASIVELREDLCDQWVRADSVIRVYETQLGDAQREALDEPPAPTDRIGVELNRLRAERYADTVAIAALLHRVNEDYEGGRLRIGALTSTALANLEKRFADRIAAVNTGLVAQGRKTWKFGADDA